MKKILLLIDDLGQGGAERQLSYLAKELFDRGYFIRLVKFFPGRSSYSDYLEKNNIKVEINLKGRNRWKRVFEIVRLIKSWKPDLTIVYKDGTCIAACLAKLFIKFKLVVSERNTTQTINSFEKLKFTVFRLANYVVPNSFSQTLFIKKNFPCINSKLITITNMIDVDQFSPVPSIKKNNSKKRVIITARLSPQKNVLLFLDALGLAKLNNEEVHFDWFGKIHSNEYYQQIVAKVKSLELEKLITFHYEGSEKINLEYRNSTHFCLPSTYEGFPNVLCEAMSTGLVCVASNVCDNPIILDDHKYLFDPFNPQDIAIKIKVMLNLSEEEYSRISNANRARIVKLCSSETFTKKYIDLL